jgi:flagellar biosynthetic protein FliP
MAPVMDKIYADAYLPLSENRISFQQAVERGAVPLRKFMLKQTREADIGLFSRMANLPKMESPDDIPMRVLIPAFVTSELKTAFQIGFIIFIPFLVIDMVVASVLMSMGMMMMSPVMVSLPFKLMLFVLVDGWHLLLGSLVQSFGT